MASQIPAPLTSIKIDPVEPPQTDVEPIPSICCVWEGRTVVKIVMGGLILTATAGVGGIGYGFAVNNVVLGSVCATVSVINSISACLLYQTQIKTLEDSVEDISKANKSVQMTIRITDKNVKELQNLNESLSKQIKARDQQIEILRQDREIQNKNLERIQKELAQTVTVMESIKTSAANFKTGTEALTNSTPLLTQTQSSLTNATIVLTSSNKNLDGHREELKEVIISVDHVANPLLATADQATHILSDINQSFTALKDLYQDIQLSLNKRDQQIDDLQKEKNILQALIKQNDDILKGQTTLIRTVSLNIDGTSSTRPMQSSHTSTSSPKTDEIDQQLRILQQIRDLESGSVQSTHHEA